MSSIFPTQDHNVSQLPPELLHEIFVYHSRPLNPDASFRLSKCFKTLLSISQVCRRWRQIALNSSDLWTHVPTGNLSLAAMFVERTGERPLTLWGNLDPRAATALDQTVHPFQALVSRIPIKRVQTISLNIISARCHHLLSLSLQHATHLRTLYIASRNGACVQLPHFDTDVPSLETVTLKCVGFSWEWLGRLSSLSSLTVDMTRGCRVDPSFYDVLDTLHFVPNLSNLDLCIKMVDIPSYLELGPQEDPRYPFDSIQDLVTLPRIRRLSLRSEPNSVYHLLANLILPRDTELCVSSMGPFDTQWDSKILSGILARHYAQQGTDPAHAQPLRGLMMRDLAPGHLIICLAFDSLGLYTGPLVSLKNSDVPAPHPLILDIYSPDDPVSLPEVFEDILDAFSKDPAVRLSLDTVVIQSPVQQTDDRDFSKCLWMSYPRMSLVRIAVVGPIVQSFAAEFNGDRLHLPFFKHLQIREFDFAKRPAVLDNILLGIERRADTLARRREASGDPNALELRGCRCNDDQLVRLSGVPNDIISRTL